MNYILLGATGSIGSQTLELAKEYKLNIIGLSLGRDLIKSKKIVEEFNPEYICIKDESSLEYFNDFNGKIFIGEKGLEELASVKCDMVINALSGSAGLKPTISAINALNDIALANKESLVMAGDIVMSLAKEKNVNIYPVDSEHSAIWQVINGENHSSIKKLIITASGGAFRDKNRDELSEVTINDALKHPNWSMGKKITVDCATMMNKGLEVIEAHHLFNIPYDCIETIMHKESIIHSMVEFKDSSIKAQMGNPDMKLPILYAINRKERVEYDNHLKLIDLHFEELSFDRFPCLKYAYDCGMQGGIMPTILNASNEAAVELFIDGKIKFLDIEKIIYKEINSYKNFNPTIDEIIMINKEIKNRILGGYKL